MATEKGLSDAIGCMATVFPQFLTREIAKLTSEIVSAAQAITDPLAAIGDTNAQSLVDEAASTSVDNITDNLKSTAEGLVGAFALREANKRINEMFGSDSSAIKKIQKSAKVGEQIVANSMLLFSIFKEAPFVAAQRMCEKIVSLSNLKIKQLECMKKHIVQMNNVVSVLAKSKNEIVNFDAELKQLSAELDLAKRDLRISVIRSGDGTVSFDENALARAVGNLKDADAILDPKSSDLNLLDVANILTSGTTSSEHITTSNIKLASMILPHVAFLLEAEMSSVTNVTRVIDFYLSGMVDVLNSFRSSSTSCSVARIRARTIQSLCDRVESVRNEIEEALSSSSSRGKTARSLLWASQIKSITTAADKVQSAAFVAGSSQGMTEAEILQSAYDGLINNINQINSTNVTSAVDDIFDLSILVTAVRKSGTRLLESLDERPLTDDQLLNFTVLVAQTATGANNRIEESIKASMDLRDTCQDFVSINIGFREDYDNLMTLFETLGFDRAKDLLDSGRFTDFFDTSISGLSYLTTAIDCLKDAALGVDDVQSRNEIASLRDELQSRRSNQLLSAADNLNFGATRILDDAKARLQDFERKKKLATSIVSKLTNLAKSLDFDVAKLGNGFDQMDGDMKSLEVGANGSLSPELDEFIGRAGSGVPICL